MLDPLGLVEVHEGIEVTATVVERVAAAAARAVDGVISLEPTLLGVAAEAGRDLVDRMTGRDGAEDGSGVAVRVDDGRARVEVCLAVGGRRASDVCAEVSRAVRAATRAQLGVELVSVRTVVVEVAALPVRATGADETVGVSS